jgi:type VI secretion system secreted protein Hcp
MALGDMFLKVETARQGVIKGEAQDAKHGSEIDVVGWSWGMRAQTAMAGAGEGSKATLNELDVVKRVDSASTALMSAMRNNELIKKAALTVRKAGSDPLEYFRITLQNARITSLDLETDGIEVVERLSIAFQRINVEYTPQGKDGMARGGMMFETEIT